MAQPRGIYRNYKDQFNVILPQNLRYLLHMIGAAILVVPPLLNLKPQRTSVDENVTAHFVGEQNNGNRKKKTLKKTYFMFNNRNKLLFLAFISDSNHKSTF